MPRTPVPIDELQRLMLEEIRTHDGCEGVTDVSIYHVTDNQTDANWSVGVIGCGNADPDEGKRVRLLTRRGYDWSDRYPLIAQAAMRLRKSSFVIDGEAVILGPDGISDFDALHTGKRNVEARLYAFDLLMDDGADMRDEPLQVRKLWLSKLLKRSTEGILHNDPEEGPIGPRLFEQACKMGLEGIVSKHRERTYKAGRSTDYWIKVKKREISGDASRQRRPMVKHRRWPDERSGHVSVLRL